MPSKKAVFLDLSVQEHSDCRHYWLIDRPAGPVSKGVCRLCGEEKAFQNYIEGSAWSNDISLAQLSGSTRMPVGVNVSNPRERLEFDEDA